MENIRDGDVKVYMLKREIRRNLSLLYRTGFVSRLGSTQFLSRVERQISDGEKFLKMLNTRAYSSCKTVDELKQRITRKRNDLKRQLVALDEGADGHQISLLEMLDGLTEAEKQERARKVKILKEEIHWLHKCLGICKNRDYFN